MAKRGFVKPLHCGYCGRTFMTWAGLSAHEQSHLTKNELIRIKRKRENEKR